MTPIFRIIDRPGVQPRPPRASLDQTARMTASHTNGDHHGEPEVPAHLPRPCRQHPHRAALARRDAADVRGLGRLEGEVQGQRPRHRRRLKPGGKVLATGSVTDGPFAEAKEIVGGFSIISADSYERAVAVAKECPIVHMPGSKIEIREMM